MVMCINSTVPKVWLVLHSGWSGQVGLGNHGSYDGAIPFPPGHRVCGRALGALEVLLHGTQSTGQDFPQVEEYKVSGHSYGVESLCFRICKR